MKRLYFVIFFSVDTPVEVRASKIAVSAVVFSYPWRPHIAARACLLIIFNRLVVLLRVEVILLLHSSTTTNCSRNFFTAFVKNMWQNVYRFIFTILYVGSYKQVEWKITIISVYTFTLRLCQLNDSTLTNIFQIINIDIEPLLTEIEISYWRNIDQTLLQCFKNIILIHFLHTIENSEK